MSEKTSEWFYYGTVTATSAAMLFGAYTGGIKGLAIIASAPAAALALGTVLSKFEKTEGWGRVIQAASLEPIKPIYLIAERVQRAIQNRFPSK